MSELEPELKALLQRAKGELSPQPNDTTRIASRLDGALHPALSSRMWVKKTWLAGVVGVALGFAGGNGLGLYPAGQGESSEALHGTAPVVTPPVAAPTQTSRFTPLSTPATSRMEPAPIVVVPAPKEAEISTTEERRAQRNPTRALSHLPATAAAKVDAGVTLDEVEQVRRVRRALSQRDASLALLLLNELDQAVPNGRLMQERDAGRAIARCIQEPRSGSATRAAFEHRHPASVHHARVSSACKQ